MRLILHTGAHFTEQERLIASVRGNADVFASQGVIVPDPELYRGLMRDTLNAMSKSPPSAQAREVLLDVMLEGAEAQRLILSDANFFRTAGTAIQKGVLYPAAAERMQYVADLFPNDEIEIFLGIRNPATLIPILYDNSTDQSTQGFWNGRRPYDIRWSDVIHSIGRAVPQASITVWCNEDAPLIWSQIIRDMAGLEGDAKISGGLDLLAAIMSKEGMQRLRSYMHNHKAMNETQRRRVIAAFLDKFVLEDEIEEELDMPGWTEALVDELTELYDEDMSVIQRLPGVTLIEP